MSETNNFKENLSGNTHVRDTVPDENMAYRQGLKNRRRIVVKVGSSSLLHSSTNRLDYHKIDVLVRELSDLKNRGKDVILVSSGATAVGREVIRRTKSSADLVEDSKITVKQACAAIGQARLMMTYQRFFTDYNQISAQILMDKNSIMENLSKYNLYNTFSELLKFDCSPIVNENDSVSYTEIESKDRLFGDNDMLSAVVAVLCQADLLIILSDIDGFYDKDPRLYKDAKLIGRIETIDESVYELAGGAGSRRGTGGMRTKLGAADLCAAQGIDTIVTNGKDPSVLYRIMQGEKVGTLFVGK